MFFVFRRVVPNFGVTLPQTITGALRCLSMDLSDVLLPLYHNDLSFPGELRGFGICHGHWNGRGSKAHTPVAAAVPLRTCVLWSSLFNEGTTPVPEGLLRGLLVPLFLIPEQRDAAIARPPTIFLAL